MSDNLNQTPAARAVNQAERRTTKSYLGKPVVVISGLIVLFGSYVAYSTMLTDPADLPKSEIRKTSRLDSSAGGELERTNEDLRKNLIQEDNEQFIAAEKKGSSFLARQSIIDATLVSPNQPSSEKKFSPAAPAHNEKNRATPNHDDSQVASTAVVSDTENSAVMDFIFKEPNPKPQVRTTEVPNPVDRGRRRQIVAVDPVQAYAEKIMLELGVPDYSYDSNSTGFSEISAYPTKVSTARVDVDEQQIESAQISQNNMPAATTQPQVLSKSPYELITLGDSHYATLNNVATTDAPSDIFATIHSGPMRGGIAAGSFTEGHKKLLLTFSRVSIRDEATKSESLCSIRAMALDMNSLEPGLVTKHNSRLLPQLFTLGAAAFGQTWLKALSQPQTTYVVSEQGAVTELQDAPTVKESLYAGGAAAAGEVITAARTSAAAIRPLTEVAANTEFALTFFDKPKCEQVY